MLSPKEKNKQICTFAHWNIHSTSRIGLAIVHNGWAQFTYTRDYTFVTTSLVSTTHVPHVVSKYIYLLFTTRVCQPLKPKAVKRFLHNFIWKCFEKIGGERDSFISLQERITPNSIESTRCSFFIIVTETFFHKYPTKSWRFGENQPPIMSPVDFW